MLKVRECSEVLNELSNDCIISLIVIPLQPISSLHFLVLLVMFDQEYVYEYANTVDVVYYSLIGAGVDVW